MPRQSFAIVFAACLFAVPAAAQTFGPPGQGAEQQALAAGPQSTDYEILGLTVKGVSDESMRSFVRQASGLSEGRTVTLPGDQAIARAIRKVYELGMFEDVEIVRERTVGDGVFLAIRVEGVPKLAEYSFTGIDEDEQEELRRKVPLVQRSPLREGEVARAKQAIRSYYRKEGFLRTSVKARRTKADNNTVALKFIVDRGQKAEVESINIAGNQQVSDDDLEDAMEKTREDRWWRFWKGEDFNPDGYEKDKQKVINYYRNHGYYDAYLKTDSVQFVREGDDTDVVVDLKVHEGPKYHVRSVEWRGNTVIPDEQLTQALDLETGEVYDASKLKTNLQGNRQGTDVRGLYMDRGYMKFNVQKNVQMAPGDSLDLVFDVREGETYEFGDITIAGNTKTKEHVIRRELYTVPGQRFSRSAIQESIRRLSQLKYFTQKSLTKGPGVQVDEEDQEVDLTYDVVEKSSDQLELSGTWAGQDYGLVLQLRFNFTNFSMQDLFEPDAWTPLPAGDGQNLSVSVQTSGSRYQRYSLSFKEPWFRGRPTPVGFSISYFRSNGGASRRVTTTDTTTVDRYLAKAGGRVFYNRRLDWPDDKFMLSTGFNYQRYNNNNYTSTLPFGVSQELALQLGLSRNSLDNPKFPGSGSKVDLSLDIAPPIGNLIQYHKWGLDTDWHVPLLNRVSLSFGAQYGYIGSLTGENVQFQRYLVGGSPFQQSYGTRFDQFGKDIMYMRGYPYRAIGPRLNGQPVGGRILNKYTSELSWLAVQSKRITAQPYLFLDAANTWNSFETFQPRQLYRSGGVGARVLVPMIGMVELAYGYNFDRFTPVARDQTGERDWTFQFTLGRGFD
jgi:outer membrane protein insertion porin family